MAATPRISALRARSSLPAQSAGPAEPAERLRDLARGDRWVLVGLGLVFLAFTALTWKTWGHPQTDFGAELTTAKRIADGGVLYDDIRYFYGPLGAHLLALAFALFGASFTTAFAFGLALALAIFAAFYALARTWLTPAFAGMATAVLMAIGFTGTLFGYVAPHTTSATVGLLLILLQILAMARGRIVLAGVFTGAAALTRPELAAAAAAAALAFLIGRALEDGRGGLRRSAPRLLGPALLLPLAALAPFAAVVGPRDLLFDQLIPLDFVRVSGLKFQDDWAPLTFSSGVAALARALVYLGLLAGLVASALRWRERRNLSALVPLGLAAGGLLALDVAAHIAGAFPGTVGIVQTEIKRLLIGMSWLPIVGVGCAVWAFARARKGRPAPLSGSWPLDLALIAAGLVLGLRAYNRFTTDTYAAYYAAPLVLMAAVLHYRIASRLPQARAAVLLALVAVFAGLAWNAVVSGPAADESFEVRTARGSYLAVDKTGAAYQRTLDLVRTRTRPGEPVLALPLEGGFPFASDRSPALRDLQLHPGVVDSAADERAAIARLSQLAVRIVVLGNSRFDAWGLPVIGVDYDRVLLDDIRRRFRVLAVFGDYTVGPGAVPEADAFRVYERRPGSAPVQPTAGSPTP